MLGINKNLAPEGLAADGTRLTQNAGSEKIPQSYYTTIGETVWQDDCEKSYEGIQRELGGAVRQDHYKEYYDKSEKYDRDISEAECAKWAMSGRCENGHIFLKKLNCGKEWCPWCGQDNSWIHERRIGRWLPKIQTMKTMGYYVIEWPITSRNKLRSQDSLKDIGKKVKYIFKTKLKYDCGLRRWHIFGDDDPEVRGYNPHLNILVNGGYMSSEKLEYIKSVLRKELNEPDLIVHYEYRSTIPEMMHTLRYVTRSTFLDYCWDPELAEELRGFKNQQVWGNWGNYDIVWSLDSDDRNEVVAKLESGTCPCCGKPIAWDKKVVSSLMIDACNAVDIGGGYYQIPCKDPPMSPLTDDDRFYLDLRHEMRVRGLIAQRPERKQEHIKCEPGQMEYEYLLSQGIDVGSVFIIGQYWNKYEVAESQFALCSE